MCGQRRHTVRIPTLLRMLSCRRKQSRRAVAELHRSWWSARASSKRFTLQYVLSALSETAIPYYTIQGEALKRILFKNAAC